MLSIAERQTAIDILVNYYSGQLHCTPAAVISSTFGVNTNTLGQSVLRNGFSGFASMKDTVLLKQLKVIASADYNAQQFLNGIMDEYLLGDRA